MVASDLGCYCIPEEQMAPYVAPRRLRNLALKVLTFRGLEAPNKRPIYPQCHNRSSHTKRNCQGFIKFSVRHRRKGGKQRETRSVCTLKAAVSVLWRTPHTTGASLLDSFISYSYHDSLINITHTHTHTHQKMRLHTRRHAHTPSESLKLISHLFSISTRASWTLPDRYQDTQRRSFIHKSKQKPAFLRRILTLLDLQSFTLSQSITDKMQMILFA